MKVWIFSDLHLEYGWLGLDFGVPHADVYIVSGGVYCGGPRRSIEFLAEHVPDLPVVFVPGNDEFRDLSVFEGFLNAGREANRCANIHLLEGRGSPPDGCGRVTRYGSTVPASRYLASSWKSIEMTGRLWSLIMRRAGVPCVGASVTLLRWPPASTY